MLICTNCNQKCACKIIGEMFLDASSHPRLAVVCSFKCLLISRLASIEHSKHILQRYKDFIRNRKIKSNIHSILQTKEQWPTIVNERRLRRFTMHAIKYVPIYDEQLTKQDVKILSKLLDQ